MITPAELDVYQECPARWYLMKNEGLPFFDFPSDSEYFHALRNVLFRMYSWRYSNNKPINYDSVKKYWDRIWWTKMTQDKSRDQEDIVEKAANGWAALEQYYGECYIKELHLFPIAINTELDGHMNGVHLRMHADVILSDATGQTTLVDFGCTSKTEWKLYNALSVKTDLTVATMELEPRGTISAATYINLIGKKKLFDKKTLYMSKDFKDTAFNTMDGVTKAIKCNAIYTSPSQVCNKCKFSGKCWF
jgi:hypothetical protein